MVELIACGEIANVDNNGRKSVGNNEIIIFLIVVSLYFLFYKYN